MFIVHQVFIYTFLIKHVCNTMRYYIYVVSMGDKTYYKDLQSLLIYLGTVRSITRRLTALAFAN